MREDVITNVLFASWLLDNLTMSKNTSISSMREDVTTNVRNVTKLLPSAPYSAPSTRGCLVAAAFTNTMLKPIKWVASPVADSDYHIGHVACHILQVGAVLLLKCHTALALRYYCCVACEFSIRPLIGLFYGERQLSIYGVACARTESVWRFIK